MKGPRGADFGVDGKVLTDCDTSLIEALLLGEAEEKPQKARLLRGRIRFRFPEREVQGGEVPWWDPDVRAWYRRVFERIPHLLYYLRPETAQLILLSSAFRDIDGIDIEQEEKQMEAQSNEFMLSLFSARLLDAALFAERMAEDGLTVVRQYTGHMRPPLRESVMNAVEASLRVDERKR